jgi:arginine-tRNA-protein transferase
LVTGLAGPDADPRHDQLIRAGFRRSQGYAYRPACPGCSACLPVRIPVERFRLGRTWRRVLKANGDLEACEREPVPTREQFALFRSYLDGRHGDGGMAGMVWDEYRSMVADSPVSSLVVEWRDPAERLIAVSLTDRLQSGLSGVYKFFDPALARRSLGSLVILWHVARARELGLAYVYLGYWIEESPKMAYKARFAPLERLGPDGWRPLEPIPATAPVAPVAAARQRDPSAA